MPIYKFLGPDNNVHLLEGPDPQTAQAHFESMVRDQPEMFAQPGVRAALKAKIASPSGRALMTEDMFGRSVDRAASAMTLGLTSQEAPLFDAAGTAIRNALPFGTKPGYSAKDAYDAARLLQAKQAQQFQAQHPVVAGASDVLGSLGMPGGEAIGKFIAGKVAPQLAAAGIKQIPLAVRAGQVARAVPVAAGLGATQGALTAAPGDVAHDAVRDAAGAVALAPVAWLGAKGVSTVAPKIAALGAKYGTPATDAVTQIGNKALTKLQGALSKEGVTPEAMQASLAKLSANGKSPSLIDVLTDAGAGPNTAKLISTAGASPEARKVASQYAADTASAVAPSLTAHTLNTLPVSEARPVAHIAAVNDALIQNAKTPMTTGVAPEEGGAAVHAELNALHDASRKVHEDAFKVVDAAHPESAVIADSQRAPVVTDVMSQVSPYTAEDFNSSNTLLKKLDSLKEGAAPEPKPPQLPPLTKDAQALVDSNPKLEGTIRQQLGLDTPVAAPTGDLSDVRPLTVRRLRDLDRWMGSQVNKLGADNPEAIQFIVGQNALRDQLGRLSDEGHIEGDPDVVSALNTAINAYAKHKATFGSGLVGDLTARNSRTQDLNVIPDFGASEHIFGSGSGLKPLTGVASGLEDVQRLVTPDAFGKLQAEAAGRYSPQDLLKYANAHPTAGETVFSPDARDAAQAAVDNAKSATAENAALKTGSGVLSTPSADFAPELAAHPDENVPVAHAGARQEILNAIGKNPTNAISATQTPMATENLSTLFDPDIAAELQAGFNRVGRSADIASNLEAVVNSGAKPHDLFSPADLAYPHRGVADVTLKKIRSLGGVSPAEGHALLKSLTGDADTGVALLSDIAGKKSSGYVSPQIAPIVAKGLATSPDPDAAAMDALRRRYGLDLPTDAPVN